MTGFQIEITASIPATSEDVRAFLNGGVPPGFFGSDVKIKNIDFVPIPQEGDKK